MVHNFDYYKQLESPNMYLCNPDLKPICSLIGQDRHLILRFNDLSELTFTVNKTDVVDEKDYNRIETKRLVYLENIGWFQITSAEETVEGDLCYKEVKAESHQTIFKNRGFISEERAYMFFNENDPTDRVYDSTNVGAMPSVVGQLVQQCGLKLADNFSDITPDHDYENWTLIYIDPILKFKAKSYSSMYESDSETNIVRHFTENNTYGYDFIINEVQSAFEVIFEFDFLYHTIKVKTLDAIVKPTDIYLSFENVVNTLTIQENSENITTVLTCEGSDLDITTVNPMGTNYIVGFGYYMQEVDDDGNTYPWMSKELITALNEWKQLWVSKQEPYAELVSKMQEKYMAQVELADDIQFTNLRVTDLKAAIDQYVSANEADKENVAAMPVTVEDVEVGHKSLKSSSQYFSNPFNDGITITAYKNAPTIKQAEGKNFENSNGYLEYSFSGESKGGTVASMIKDYIMPTEDNADPEDCYLYFSDGDAESYCKLTIASEVGVAKDSAPSDGVTPIAMPIEHNNGVGYVEVRGVIFKVINRFGTVEVYDNSNNQKINPISGHSDYFEFNGARHRIVKSADNYITIYCYYVSGFQRHTAYKNLTGNTGWLTTWEGRANTLNTQDKTIQKEIDDYTTKIKAINDECNVQKYIKNKGEVLYDELFHYWIEGTYTNDNLATESETSMADRISLAKELMKSGEAELEKAAQPTFEMSVDVINFLPLLEFKEFSEQLELGKVITIEKNDKICYYPALIAIEYDIDERDNFSLTFSSAARPNETAMTIADLLKEASDTSRTVTSNWADLTDFAKNKEAITSLIEAPLNRALRAAQASLSNQEFIIDETGILGRRYKDDSHLTFSDEQVRLINNLLIFTDDNWKTAKTALGKTDYGYGLIAEVIVGELMLGEQLYIGNGDGTVVITGDGIAIKDGSDKVVFNADKNGNITVRNYATSGDLETAVTEINTTIEGIETRVQTIEDDYVTSSVLKQTSDSIMGEVSKEYATKEGSSEKFSYTLVSDKFVLSANGKEVFKATKDGIAVTGSGEFTGTIYASAGTIAGLTVTEDSLESIIGNNRFILNSSQLFIGTDSKNITFSNTGELNIVGGSINAIDGTIKCNDLQTKTLKLADGKIGFIDSANKGGYIDLNYNFGASSTKMNFIAKITGYTSEKELKWVIFDVIYSYRYTFTVHIGALDNPDTNKILIESQSFVIVYKVMNKEYRITVTIPAGSYQGTGTGEWIESGSSVQSYNFQANNSKEYTFSQNNNSSGNNVAFNASLCPTTNGSYNLGADNNRWNTIYAIASEIGSSDRNRKQDITRLPSAYIDLFYELEPVIFKFKQSDSGRTHIGLIAQQVKDLLDKYKIDSKDFAAYCEWINNDGEVECGLRYSEFIPMCISEIQRLRYELERLKIQKDR